MKKLVSLVLISVMIQSCSSSKQVYRPENISDTQLSHLLNPRKDEIPEASFFGLYYKPVKQGLLVWDEVEGSPADKAGLQHGDIIVSIGGILVHTNEDMIKIITTTPVGTEVEFVYLRDNKEYKVLIKSVSRP